MKYLIIFIFSCSNLVVAQERQKFLEYFPLDELIKGEWELEKFVVSKMHESNFEYCDLPAQYRRLIFTESHFEVKYNPQNNENALKKIGSGLFYELWSFGNELDYYLAIYSTGKKGKKNKSSYNGYFIKQCGFQRLILYERSNSHPFERYAFDYRIYSVFKRKEKYKYSESDFAGTWYSFNDSTLDFNANIILPIRLTKSVDTLNVRKYDWFSEMKFNFGVFENQIEYFNQTNSLKKKIERYTNLDGTISFVQDAVYLKEPKFNFWIDFKNQLIYLLHDTISVYHFNFDDEGALILTWDMERTKNLKKIER
jgi:hypothetical protein